MNTVHIRNIALGEGIPKICVPIVARTCEAILEEAKRIRALSADLVEWRADWFEDVFTPGKTEEVLAGLRSALGDMPLLFTFRTRAEGGACEADTAAYGQLIRRAVHSGFADLVDVELFSGPVLVSSLVELAHACGVKVIVSNHDFERTPDPDELLRRLSAMEALGADLPKIAVMPGSPEDVLALLSATCRARRVLSQPVITMAMAGAGVVSRLSGEIFGSALTFGSASQASAPGQISVTELRQTLELLHRSL